MQLSAAMQAKIDAKKQSLLAKAGTRDKLIELKNKFMLISRKPVYSDMDYKVGVLIGLLQQCVFYPAVRSRLCEKLGIPESYIDDFQDCFGQIPSHTKSGRILERRDQKSEELRELLILISVEANLPYEESDFDDITQDRWDLRADKAEKLQNAAFDDMDF